MPAAGCWIDTYHSVRNMTPEAIVFLTDSAVGSKEEDNLRHLVINLGKDVPRSGVVPFLTCKHSMEYCLAYADRARDHGFEALVVLGGDKSIGPARCVEHAWQLREEIRRRVPDLALGWANRAIRFSGEHRRTSALREFFRRRCVPPTFGSEWSDY